MYYYLIRSNGETGIINNKTQDVIKILDILKKHFKYVDELKDEIEFFIISKIHIYISKQRFQKSYEIAINNADELKRYILENNIEVKKLLLQLKDIS